MFPFALPLLFSLTVATKKRLPEKRERQSCKSNNFMCSPPPPPPLSRFETVFDELSPPSPLLRANKSNYRLSDRSLGRGSLIRVEGGGNLPTSLCSAPNDETRSRPEVYFVRCSLGFMLFMVSCFPTGISHQTLNFNMKSFLFAKKAPRNTKFTSVKFFLSSPQPKRIKKNFNDERRWRKRRIVKHRSILREATSSETRVKRKLFISINELRAWDVTPWRRPPRSEWLLARDKQRFPGSRLVFRNSVAGLIVISRKACELVLLSLVRFFFSPHSHHSAAASWAFPGS